MSRVAILALLGVGLIACTEADQPGETGIPAVRLTVIGRAECASPDEDGLCLTVRIVNDGEAGDASCELVSTTISSSGDETVVGPRIPLSDLASGETVTRVVAWTGDAAPLESFRGICEPGLRS